MNVSEVMSSGVWTCAEDDSANRAAELMWKHDIGIVPIVDGERRLVAVVTDRDICMAAHLEGRRLTEIPAMAAASRQVFAAHVDDTVEVVEGLMQRHQVRRIPIVDKSERIVGIVSMNDLARATRRGVGATAVAGTLAAICEPFRTVAAE